jgi:hypothetical protein
MCFLDINYLLINESLFIECFSKHSGGCFAISSSSSNLGDISINNSSFLHSFGDNFGGCIYLNFLNNSNFTSTSFFNCSSLDLYTFLGTNTGYGGGIDVNNVNITYICNCSFISCVAALGGVILIIILIILY